VCKQLELIDKGPIDNYNRFDLLLSIAERRDIAKRSCSWCRMGMG